MSLSISTYILRGMITLIDRQKPTWAPLKTAIIAAKERLVMRLPVKQVKVRALIKCCGAIYWTEDTVMYMLWLTLSPFITFMT